jgi:hypothetical protein
MYGDWQTNIVQDNAVTMTEISAGLARLEYVLDQACLELLDGGSHEMRSFIADSLMAAAQAGDRSLEGLMEVTREAASSLDSQLYAKTA